MSVSSSDSPSAAFADPARCAALRREIEKTASGGPPITLMEVCGTHTTALFRFGLREMLPPEVRVISGPGCPVCVTPTAYIDLALRLLDEPRLALVTFGDMMRVPGSRSSLERRRARGGRVEVVYSALDALALAAAEPQTRFVFLAVGFETTAPGSALLLRAIAERRIANLYLLVAHKLVPPALEALLGRPDLRVDGLILPGHVSVILGTEVYRPIAERHGVPGVVCGFEPVDLLSGILELVRMRRDGTAAIVNRYGRAVTPQGNRLARASLSEWFLEEDAEWRGLGPIPGSGLRLRPEFSSYDGLGLLPPSEIRKVEEAVRDHEGCRCGDVLCGTVAPPECPLFGEVCTPENPIGACMVSTEGTCAAYFKYARGWSGGVR